MAGTWRLFFSSIVIVQELGSLPGLTYMGSGARHVSRACGQWAGQVGRQVGMWAGRRPDRKHAVL